MPAAAAMDAAEIRLHVGRLTSIAGHLRRGAGDALAAAATAAAQLEPPLHGPQDPQEPTLTNPSQLHEPALEYTAHDPAAIEAALRTDGVAFLRDVLPPATVAALSKELLSYEPLPVEQGSANNNMAAVGSQNFITLFQRDPCWLALFDPSPIIDVLDSVLGDQCHVITQKGWRHAPGHDATGGTGNGGMHCDELFVELPERLAMDPEYTPPIHILTALVFLNGTSRALCPTRVVPGTFRSGRRPLRSPTAPELTCLSDDSSTRWRGREAHVALAAPGDALLFRSDVWHAGSVNLTADQTRLCVETAFGARKVRCVQAVMQDGAALCTLLVAPRRPSAPRSRARIATDAAVFVALCPQPKVLPISRL